MLNFILKPCYWNLFKIGFIFLYTRQSWLKTALLRTALNSFRTRLTYHVWGAMLERYKSFQAKPENINELQKVLQLI